MDELIRDSVIAFVVLFVAIGGLITWYSVRVHRDERAGISLGDRELGGLAGDQRSAGPGATGH